MTDHVLAEVDNDAEATDLMVGLARARLAEGGVVVLAADEAVQDRVLARVGPQARLQMATRHDRHQLPVSRLVDSQLLAEATGQDGSPVHFVHHVAPVPQAYRWDWIRVENVVTSTLAVHEQVCVYSREDVEGRYLDAVRSSHPLHHHDGETRAYPGADESADVLRRLLREPAAEPTWEPSAELHAPSIVKARHAATVGALDARLGVEGTAALLFGVTEAVSNTWQHGRSPVTVRTWVSPGRVHVAVADAGPGPAQPTVGLIREGEGGMGLWMSHQMLDVRHEIRADAYVVHLVGTRQNDSG